MLQAGDKLPLNVRVKNSDSQRVTLKQYLGKPLVIYFHPGNKTPGCILEATGFRSLTNSIHQLGAEFLGVSKDSVLFHRKFKRKLNLNFEFLSDEKHRLLEAFGVWQEKRMFGRSYMGAVRSTFIVDSVGEIIKVFPRIKPERNIHEVYLVLEKITNPRS